MTTMAYEKSGGVLIVVHTAQAPSAIEWSKWVERMGRRDFDSILVVTKGGGPNGSQRTQAVNFWKGQSSTVKIAAITDASVVRGILTALHWLGFSDMKAFSSREISSALTYLSVLPDNQSLVLNMVMILQRDLAKSSHEQEKQVSL